MDEKTLRKQIYEEIHAQFAAKLREARQQKSELEEEIELAEEKSRNERRRLNSDIDRLESALADAREARRKSATPRQSKTLDPDEIANLQAAAEEKLRKAEQSWTAERTKLKSEVSRLQNGIAELIERSNNPLRATHVETEKLESRLEEAVRAKRQAEDALLAAKREWDEEKLKLVGEMVKGRRADSPSTAGSKQDNERVGQLEKQLEEATKAKEKQARDSASTIEKLERELEKTRQALSALKAGQSESAVRLKAELEEARNELKQSALRLQEANDTAESERAGLEKQLREAAKVQKELERELEKSRQVPTASKGMPSGDTARLKVELEEARKINKSLERRLSEAGDSVSAEVVEQLRRQYDERMQDMIKQKTQLSEQLRSATSLLEAERIKLGADGVDGHKAGADAGINSETIDAEVERIQEMIAGIARLIDNPETELSTVIRKNVERAELDAYLKGILFSLGRGRGF